MCCKGISRVIGVLPVLSLLSFTSTRSIEIAHPIEEGHQESHRHDEANGLSMVCEQTGQHCLHQHGLSSDTEPLHLVPEVMRRAGAAPFNDSRAFLNTRIIRLRGPPGNLSA